jgi:hypothetical protein
MTATAAASLTPSQVATLDDVEAAYRKRDDLLERLNAQNQYVGEVVRKARAAGNTWAAIAERAGTSDVAVLKASRRPELERQTA